MAGGDGATLETWDGAAGTQRLLTHPHCCPQASSEKPKRPISAMFIFSEEKRKQLQEERPELSESELTRLLARMWNDLSEKKKVGDIPNPPPKPHLTQPSSQRASRPPRGFAPFGQHSAVPGGVTAITHHSPPCQPRPRLEGWKVAGSPGTPVCGGGLQHAGEGRPSPCWCSVRGLVPPLIPHLPLPRPSTRHGRQP